MIDRTTVTLTLLSVPEADVRAVLDVIDDYELQAAEDVVGDVVGLALPYQSGSVDGEAANAIAYDLTNNAPGAAFDVHTDACAEYSGVGVVRLPDTFDHDHDYEVGVDGEPIVAVQTLMEVRTLPELGAVIGRRHFDHLAGMHVGLSKLPALDRIARLPACETCETRTRCTCEADAEDEAHAMNDAFDRLPALT